MKKSELFNALPDISFTDTDTDTISSDIISRFESLSGRTLATADPVRLFLLTIADIISQQRSIIDIAAKNNLLAYAEGSYLDHIGALLGVTRLTDEDDEAFRQRIHIAPESFSVAGPAKAYEFHAKKAHSDILDVKILTPPDTQPGHVEIYPLMKGGNLPSTEVLDAVFMACSDDTVRPDTDYVEVYAPAVINYNVRLTFWVDKNNSALSANISQAVNDSVADWVTWQKSALGRDINPSELTRRIINAGAKRCEISSPAFTPLTAKQVAVAGNISVIYGGLEEG